MRVFTFVNSNSRVLSLRLPHFVKPMLIKFFSRPFNIRSRRIDSPTSLATPLFKPEVNIHPSEKNKILNPIHHFSFFLCSITSYGSCFDNTIDDIIP